MVFVIDDLIKGFLGAIAATADITRFKEWEGKLENALEELEEGITKKKMTKTEYEETKKNIKERLKKAHGSMKKKLISELKKFETEYKKKRIKKGEYEGRKKILIEKLEKAKELLKKSEERLEKATKIDIRW